MPSADMTKGLTASIVEDDPAIASALSDWLIEAGFATRTYRSAEALFAQTPQSLECDVLLLDWMLPGALGDQIIVRVRGELDYRNAIIFITSRDSPEDIAHILALGADDYIVKPPIRKVVLARIGAVLRRASKDFALAPLDKPDPLPYQISRPNREIFLHSQQISLTRMEYEVAVYLFDRVNQLVKRTDLIHDVWKKPDGLDTRTVDVHLCRLRKKMTLRPENGYRLVSVHSVGYRLEKV